MARPVSTDYLQAFPFWMMDTAHIGLMQAPIFNPLLGFASISAPALSVETYSIREGNWFLDRHVVQRGSYGTFSVRRAATFYDSDFYQWVMASLSGNVGMRVSGVSYRRPLMLIHFFSRNPTGGSQTLDADSVARAKALAITDPSNAGDYRRQQQFNETGIGGNIAFGPIEFAVRVPAKAFMLKGCVPISWRPGNDFDATDGSVSIAELDFACEMVEEISLGKTIGSAVSSVVGTATSAIETLLSSAL